MGIVLGVTQLPLGEQIAFKMVLPEAATSLAVHARFLREAQSAVCLRGEHVARIVDLGIMPDGVPYLVMEDGYGVGLAGELARRGALSTGEAVDYALQTCDALAEAHAHGIVHGDIQPGNVFLTPRPDGTPLVKILDFGVARTPAEVDPRTDIRGVGAVLHECLTGLSPFPRKPSRASASEQPRPLGPQVPGALREAVRRCLDRDRDRRFPSIAALTVALAPFAPDRAAAAAIVERATLLSRGIHGAGEPAAPQAQYPVAAMVSGTAVVRSRSPRRTEIIAMVAIAASIGGISAAALIGPDRSRSPFAAPQARVSPGKATTTPDVAPPAAADPPTGAPPVADPSAATPAAATPPSAEPPAATTPSADPPPATAPGATRSSATSPDAIPPAATPPANPPTTSPPTAAKATSGPPAATSPGTPPPTTTQPGAAPSNAAAATDVEKTRKLDACTTLLAQKAWPALEACAFELAKLGLADQAREFHTTAKRELPNQQQNDRVRQALRDGNLKDAEAALEQIGPSSVYFAAARDSFLRAEQQRVDDARQRAQALASAHDCASLERLVRQLTTTTTDAVVAAAQAVGCEDRSPPTERAATDRTGARPARPSPPAISTAPARRNEGCSAGSVDDLMTRAAIQYDAGAAPSALSLARAALACKQTDRMYWLAVMYACAARDLANARLYFPKVPVNLQSGLERKCQQENLDVRSR